VNREGKRCKSFSRSENPGQRKLTTRSRQQFLFDSFGGFIFGDFEIVARLQIQPEPRCFVEVSSKPKRRIRRDARRSWTISEIRVTGPRKSSASLFMLTPRGFKYSSRRISPGWIGGRSFFLRRIGVSLIIVDHLHLVRIWIMALKTDPPLVVDTNAV
jgi:hypothetical protein